MRITNADRPLYDAKYPVNPNVDGLVSEHALDIDYEERKLLEKRVFDGFKRGDSEESLAEDMETLIKGHLKILKKVASSLIGYCDFDLDDLMGEVSLQMVIMIRRNNPEKAILLTTLVNYLRRQVAKALRDKSFLKITDTVRTRTNEIKSIIDRYPGAPKTMGCYEASDHLVQWLLEQIGTDEAMIRDCLESMHIRSLRPISLYAYVLDTHESKAAYKTDDPVEEVPRIATGHEWMYLVDAVGCPRQIDMNHQDDLVVETDYVPKLQARIEEVFKVLPYRYRKVLKLRYGLNGRAHTFDEIGELFNITGTAAKNIRDRAITKLQQGSQSAKLREFVRD